MSSPERAWLVWDKCWSRGAVWSARRPVKPEVAGSNPVGTATTVTGSEGLSAPGTGFCGYGRVAQLVERSPEKR